MPTNHLVPWGRGTPEHLDFLQLLDVPRGGVTVHETTNPIVPRVSCPHSESEEGINMLAVLQTVTSSLASCR